MTNTTATPPAAYDIEKLALFQDQKVFGIFTTKITMQMSVFAVLCSFLSGIAGNCIYDGLADSSKRDAGFFFSIMLAVVTLLVVVIATRLQYFQRHPAEYASEVREALQSFEVIANQYRDQCVKYKEDAEYDEWMIASSTCSIQAYSYMCHVLPQLLQPTPATPVNLAVVRSHLDKLILPLWTDKDSIFGFESGDGANFALYLFDDVSKYLKPLWRCCDVRISVGRQDRWFRPGEGQIGFEYQVVQQDQKNRSDFYSATRIILDATDKEHKQSYAMTDEDASKYASFVTIPITSGSNGRLIGVFQISSCMKNFFENQESSPTFKIIQSMVSCYLGHHADSIKACLNEIEPATRSARV